MREVVLSELGVAAQRPVMRAVGMAVIHNPFAGRFVGSVESTRQVLGAGGRLGTWAAAGFELVDRKGRTHRYPRSWAPSSSSSAGT